MSAMDYNAPGWRPPWRHTLQARCVGVNCTPDCVPGLLVMACTLDEDGLCVACARTPAGDGGRELRLGV